ncbi:uncharacterized protein LOC144434636 [Glandiceps talaboti]
MSEGSNNQVQNSPVPMKTTPVPATTTTTTPPPNPGTPSDSASPRQTQSPSDNPTHAPKYGTVIPNRIFVGGIAFNTTEIELKRFFTNFGMVKEAKIIADRAGVSKGYGFITFETPEEAARIQQENGDNLIFKDKKLNIGPAVRKQPTTFPVSDVDPAPAAPNGMVIHHPGGYSYTYQNGVAYFHPESQMTPTHITPHTQPPQPASVYQPYAVSVMMPPQPAPQYIPTTTTPQYTAYQQPPPNTPPWSPPTGQWRWMAPQQSQTMNTTGMVPVYPTCTPTNEMMYPPSPYPGAEIAEVPMPMVEPGQAENATVPGLDQQAAMNRTYIADISHQEPSHITTNYVPKVNPMKMNGPRKPFISRGGRRNQARGSSKVMSGPGVSVLANTARIVEDGGIITTAMTSPPPEK